jgi:hypothetical protein
MGDRPQVQPGARLGNGPISPQLAEYLSNEAHARGTARRSEGSEPKVRKRRRKPPGAHKDLTCDIRSEASYQKIDGTADSLHTDLNSSVLESNPVDHQIAKRGQRL